MRLPVVTSRDPLWTEESDRGIIVGLRNDLREVLVTALMDAEPHHGYVLPGSSIWPFLTALGVGIGLARSVAAFSWYLHRLRARLNRIHWMVLAACTIGDSAMNGTRVIDVSGLPPYNISNKSPLWWGQAMMCLI